MIREVVERGLRQSEAALRLGLSVRQVKRLVRRYRDQGPAGLLSARRGKRPNNAIDEGVRRAVLGLVRDRYPDFGPTRAWKNLVGEHGYRLSVETLRGWMIQEGLWQPKARRDIVVHDRRSSRDF